MDADKKYLSDSEIVELFFERDESAIRETERKYSGYIFSVAKNFLSNSDDCKECENDTYLALWNAIPPAKPDSLTPFLAKITRGIAIDRYRERTRQKRVPSELTLSFEELDGIVGDGFSEEDATREIELRRVINGFIASLSEKSRFIFICRYFSADSAEDIAKMLGITKWSVFKELKKLKEQLKEILTKEDLL